MAGVTDAMPSGCRICGEQGALNQLYSERRDVMSLIPCTDPCIYQKEGCCTLETACSGGLPGGCVHFLPSQQNSQGLADVPHRNEREPLRRGDSLPPLAFGDQALGKAQAPDL